MPDLNIDTTSQQYRNLVAGLPLLAAQMASRKALLLRLARQRDRVRLQQWMDRDPLLADTVQFVENAHKVISKIQEALG